MENKGIILKGASRAEWFVMEAIVAQAVAIIKNKPSGLSGREYAEVLTRQLKSHDEDCRKKGQELQQEVLRLRQELLLSRAEAAEPDGSMDKASQDRFGPDGLGYSTEGPPGCDSETPELLLQDHRAPITPPQPPGPSCPPESTMLPHVQFLQSLCGLHQVKGTNRGLEALWFRPDGDAGSVLADTVCQLLQSVVAVCRDPPPLGPPDLVLQASQVVAGAMDLFCSQRLPSVEFMRRVEESLRELTGMLLDWNQPSKLQAAEQLMGCLITLGSSSMSKFFLIRHILSQISALADQLWQAFQGQEGAGLDRFPVDQYQNSSYLFRIVEELLHKSKVACRVEVEVGSEHTGVLGHLEQRVFLLSDEFPLFSIYMWRIGGLLTSSDR